MSTTAGACVDLSGDVAVEVRPVKTASGWWILPIVLAGAAAWIGLFVLIF